MLLAFAALFLIAVAADYVLDQAGYSSAERGSTPSVRLD
jgi:hypothetical protein